MRILLALALFLGACTAVPTSAQRPADFAVRYSWSTGSLPPPYHYGTTIRIEADGSGEAETTLSYGEGPSHAIPFHLDEAALDALYAALHGAGLFSTGWQQPDPSRIPVGGSSWSLRATADGREVRVPSYAEPRRGADRIRALVLDIVPEAVLADLDAWREAT